MPEPRHELLGAYLLGRLDPAETAAFRHHLAGCERCRGEEASLAEVATLLQRTSPVAPPEGLEARMLAAVAAAARVATATPSRSGPDAPTGLFAPKDDALAGRRHRTLRGVGAGLAVAAGLALAFLLGTGTASDTTTTVAQVKTVPDTSLPGSEEKAATLRGDGGEAQAVVNVTGPGRVVSVKSTSVARIPKGTYYELWFVGPRDTPDAPNRVSAGTWHPDKRGVTDVRFLIAADPAKFPDIEVTREPPDGDPAPSGRVVLRSG